VRSHVGQASQQFADTDLLDRYQTRGVQALLPAVTSVSANLHGQYLLLAVRTVYNIFLNARDSISQTTARAALTQMVDTVFHRTMGFGDVRAKPIAPHPGSDRRNLTTTLVLERLVRAAGARRFAG